MALQWAEPPANAVAGGTKHTKWGEVAGILRMNPGRSALVATKPSRQAAVALTNGITGGKRAEFEPAGSFTASYAPNAGNPEKYDVFASFGANSNGNGNGAMSAAGADDDGTWDDDEDDVRPLAEGE